MRRRDRVAGPSEIFPVGYTILRHLLPEEAQLLGLQVQALQALGEPRPTPTKISAPQTEQDKLEAYSHLGNHPPNKTHNTPS
ncbi:MAG: hypothetical protein AAGJ35_14700 [Myxococcota bacterium]